MPSVTETRSLAAARSQFAPAGTYLNTATYGLPCRAASRAFAEVAGLWAEGRYSAPACDHAVATARAGLARLVGVDSGDVAIGHQVSPLVGLVAASLPAGSRVLAAEGDFTSLLFPFLAQAPRAVSVRTVALEDLPEAVEATTAAVAVSAVQSADGRLADLDAIGAAARHHGALVLVDATQACGWLPLQRAPFDVLVCGGYKWLGHPRGTAFLAVRPEHRDDLLPQGAGWYAHDEPWGNCYGTPLRLADSARRFDASPGWFGWHAAVPAIELLERVGIDAIHDHDVALANRFRAGVGLEPSDSAIVSADLDPGAGERLAAAGVATAVRAGRVRLSFHLHNDDDDVDVALRALGVR